MSSEDSTPPFVSPDMLDRPPTPNAEAAANELESLPTETHPTVAFAIPFPKPKVLPEKEKDRLAIPPFVLYAPLAAALQKPAEGEKESMVHKAQRKWQKEESDARAKGTGFKAKAVGLISKGMAATKNSRIEFLVRTPEKRKLKELRIFFPASSDTADMQAQFEHLLKAARNGALRNGVVATGLLPFVFAFDVLTFVMGPFEINAVWAASSWTGFARSNAITRGVTSSQIPLSFLPDPRLNALAYRLHELCWLRGTSKLVDKPHFEADATPKRGSELAGLVLDVLKEQLGGDLSGVETNRIVVSQDIERMLKKGAKEWVKALK